MAIDINQVPSPCYVLDEQLLRNNLQLIRSVAERAGVEIIVAFKGFAMWSSFPVVREYVRGATASSPHEARLAFEEMKSLAHTYSPAYIEREFDEICQFSSHITFNSLAQFERFAPLVRAFEQRAGRPISLGLRINPEFAVVATDLYFPNGSMITPDGQTLIVGETMGNRISAFDIRADGSLGPRRDWARFGELPALTDMASVLGSLSAAPDGDDAALLALRTQIDGVDRELLAQLNRRAALALQVGAAQLAVRTRKAEAPLPLLAEYFELHRVRRRVDVACVHPQPRGQQCHDADGGDAAQPALKAVVVRLVGRTRACTVTEAPQGVDDEQVDDDKEQPGDDDGDRQRGVHRRPVRSQRREPPGGHQMEDHRAGDDQQQCDGDGHSA